MQLKVIVKYSVCRKGHPSYWPSSCWRLLTEYLYVNFYKATMLPVFPEMAATRSSIVKNDCEIPLLLAKIGEAKLLRSTSKVACAQLGCARYNAPRPSVSKQRRDHRDPCQSLRQQTRTASNSTKWMCGEPALTAMQKPRNKQKKRALTWDFVLSRRWENAKHIIFIHPQL